MKLRYKEPDGERSRLLSVAVEDDRDQRPTADARFAAAVAGFGMLLRDSEHKGAATWARVLELAEGARGEDREGYRAQFLELVRTAAALAASRQATAVRLR